MPIEIRALENGGIYWYGHDTVTGDDVIEANATTYRSEEKIRVMKYQIVDLRRVDELEITPDEVRTVAEQDRAAFLINPGILVAVVGEKDIVYGYARMWQAYLGEYEIRSMVFREIEEAERWIRKNLKKDLK